MQSSGNVAIEIIKLTCLLDYQLRKNSEQEYGHWASVAYACEMVFVWISVVGAVVFVSY